MTADKMDETDEITDWSKIEGDFDKIKKFDAKFYYLRQIIDLLKVCESATCPIFHSLHELKDKFKALMLYGYNTYNEAKTAIENPILFKKWEKDYIEFDNKAEHVFSMIYAMKISRESQNEKHKQYYDEYLGTLKVINENNYDMPIETQTGTQAKMNEIAGSAIGLDESLKDKRIEFEKFMEIMKKKEKIEKELKKKGELNNVSEAARRQSEIQKNDLRGK